MTDKRTCADCSLAFMVDEGYSNYTVEGTTFYCGVNAHPDGHFDRFYNEEKRLEYAVQCPHFLPGGAYCVDVERDCWTDTKMTVAQRIMWKALGNEDGPK